MEIKDKGRNANLTVKRMKEILSQYPDDYIIVISPISHIISVISGSAQIPERR